jgi:membrane protease YdiL (CAAX protease family)
MRNGYFTIAASIAIAAGVLAGFNLIDVLFLLIFNGADIDSAPAELLLTINSLSQILCIIGIPLLLSIGFRMNIKDVFRIKSPGERYYGLIVPTVIMIISAQIFAASISAIWIDFLSLFPQLYGSLTEFQSTVDTMMQKLTSIQTPSAMTIGFISIAVIPAIAEELFFRGFLFTHIERSGLSGLRPTTALIITSLIFGLGHFSPFNFPGLAAIGAVLGWMMITSGTIFISMFAHFVNNGMIILALYSNNVSGQLQKDLTGTPELPLSTSLIMMIISAILLSFSGRYFQYKARVIRSYDPFTQREKPNE